VRAREAGRERRAAASKRPGENDPPTRSARRRSSSRSPRTRRRRVGFEAARESALRGEAEADRAAHAVHAYRVNVAAGRLLRVNKSPRALALARMPGGVWGAARLPHLHVFACLGSCFLPSFTHPSRPAPTRLGNLYLSPLRLRLRVCGAAHVGAGVSTCALLGCRCASLNRSRGCGHARDLCSLQRCYCTRGCR
jgi:hypothetical protein